jgi:hypothetical protein
LHSASFFLEFDRKSPATAGAETADCKFVSQHPMTSNSSDDDPGNNDAILVKYARYILRSVDYNLLPADFGCGSFFILPLRMARTVLLQEHDVYISHGECQCIYAKRLSDYIRQEAMTERGLKEIARTKIVIGFWAIKREINLYPGVQSYN